MNAGYIMPAGDKEFQKEEDIPLGVEEWKGAFPHAIWPGYIPASLPMGGYGILEIGYDEEGIELPVEIALVTAGSLSEKFSFFGNLNVSHEEGEGRIELHDLFAQFNSILETPLLFMRFGTSNPSIILSPHLHYSLTDIKPIAHTYSPFEGAFSFENAAPLLEFSGNRSFTKGGGGFSYRSGIFLREEDGVITGDPYFSISLKAGGYPVGRVDSDAVQYIKVKPAKERSFTTSLFVYSGSPLEYSDSYKFYRAGVSGLLRYSGLEILGTFWYGKDYTTGEGGASNRDRSPSRVSTRYSHG